MPNPCAVPGCPHTVARDHTARFRATPKATPRIVIFTLCERHWPWVSSGLLDHISLTLQNDPADTCVRISASAPLSEAIIEWL